MTNNEFKEATEFIKKSERMIPEVINHPEHYTQGGTETIEIMKSKLTPEEFIGYCKGNIIKYITRERYKGSISDLRKAEWYAKELVAFKERNLGGFPNG